MAETMRFGTHEKVFYFVHTEAPPDEREWEESMVVAIDKAERKLIDCYLIFTDGGAPNANQRRRITDSKAVSVLPTSVLTDSIFVRGVLTALNWMGKVGKPFAPAHVQSALDHLAIPRAQRNDLLRAVALQKLSLAALGTVEALDQKMSRSDSKWIDTALGERVSRLKENFPQL
jgi:hypothetical protein